MPTFKVDRATERDQAVIAEMIIQACNQTPLWGLQRDRLAPGPWFAARAPIVLVRDRTTPVGFAAAAPGVGPLVGPRCAEAIVYVAPPHRRQGAARTVLGELVATARVAGIWKLVACSLADDPGPRTLFDRTDFRDVGTLVKHVYIEGVWRDLVVHEKLLFGPRRTMPSIPDK